VSVRRAGPDDALTLARIQEEASLAALAHIYPPDRYPFPTEAVVDRWRSFTASGGWIALGPDGFIAVEPPWLEAMYVRPRAWGSGLAAELHAAAVAELRARGVDAARLWVLEHNVRARRFYERHGWRADGTSRVVEFPPNPTDVGYTLALSTAS
jgi:GNAT superfamily N-acetyltransferase